ALDWCGSQCSRTEGSTEDSHRRSATSSTFTASLHIPCVDIYLLGKLSQFYFPVANCNGNFHGFYHQTGRFELIKEIILMVYRSRMRQHRYICICNGTSQKTPLKDRLTDIFPLFCVLGLGIV